ncbi:MAG: hypothetical protein V3U75_13080 [Methylococcaceae bacterium]
MRKSPVNIRREQAKKAFLAKLDEWISEGYHAKFSFSTENGIIKEDIVVNKNEKLKIR